MDPTGLNMIEHQKNPNKSTNWELLFVKDVMRPAVGTQLGSRHCHMAPSYSLQNRFGNIRKACNVSGFFDAKHTGPFRTCSTARADLLNDWAPPTIVLHHPSGTAAP